MFALVCVGLGCYEIPALAEDRVLSFATREDAELWACKQLLEAGQIGDGDEGGYWIGADYGTESEVIEAWASDLGPTERLLILPLLAANEPAKLPRSSGKKLLTNEMMLAKEEEKPDELTAHDWDQVVMAAKGCVSGTSDEWPHLRRAIAKLRGEPFGPRKGADWLRGFCEGVILGALIQEGE